MAIEIHPNLFKKGMPELDRINDAARALLVTYYETCEQQYMEGVQKIIVAKQARNATRKRLNELVQPEDVDMIPPIAAPAPVEEWSKTSPAEDFLNLPLVRGTFNVLSSPLGALTNTLVGALDPNTKGTNTAEQFSAGASDFYKDHPIASYGTLGLGNIIGGLSNLGQQSKTGEDLVKASYAAGLRTKGIDVPTASRMSEEMAKANPTAVAAGGLAWNLGADPVNFMTGGESAIAKSLARGAQDEALRIAKEAGIKTTRKTAIQDVPNKLYEQTIEKYKGNESLGQLPVLQKGTIAAEDRIAKLAEKNKMKAASQI
jgi:hypothetical protein